MRKMVLIALIFCFVGCMDSYDDRLQIINSDNLAYFIAFSETDFLSENDYTEKAKSNEITTILKTGRNAWPYFVESSKNQELHIFIISDSVHNKYNWKEIIRKKLYTYKSVPLAELEANDWLVEVGGK